MANEYYDNSDVGQRFQSGEIARGVDVDAKLDAISTGLDKLPTPIGDGTGFSVALAVGPATAAGHAATKAQMDSGDATLDAKIDTVEADLRTTAFSYTATSATSLTIGLGTKSLTIQTGKDFVPGLELKVADTTAPDTNWMKGTVTSYNSTTGALVVEASQVAGSGTLASWSIAPTSIVLATSVVYEEFLVSGTWTKPVGAISVYVEAIGGGGGGDNNVSNGNIGGGGGGSFAATSLAAVITGSTEVVTVGAGGFGAPNGGSYGLSGGTSSFGTHLSARGGQPPVLSAGGFGGGGEPPAQDSTVDTFAAGGFSSGGGGYGSSVSGGRSVMGGGGGGGCSSTNADGPGGVSQNGGNGGASESAANTSGIDGAVPGGGGGASSYNGGGGAGGAGRVRIWTVKA